MNEEKGFSKIVKYYIPITAIFFSAISLFISIKSCSIANKSYQINEKNYEVNLNPILSFDFITNIYNKDYSLKIINDGPISVIELKIYKVLQVFDRKEFNRCFGIFSYNEPWYFCKEILPNDSIIIPIPFDDFKKVWYDVSKEQLHKKNEVELHTLIFKISYRKEPDRIIYKKRKYLFIEPIVMFGDTTLFGLDPEYTTINHYRDTWKKLESFEKKRVWVSKFF